MNDSIDQRPSKLSEVYSRARDIPEFGVIVAFVSLVILFTALNPVFFTLKNLSGVFTVVSELGMETIGEAFLIISGEFDLSVGSVYAFSGYIFAKMAEYMPSPIAALLTLSVAAGIGYFNAVLVLRFRIPSFIATLGGMWVYRGLLFPITGGKVIPYTGDHKVFIALSKQIGWFRPSHVWFLGMGLLFSFLLTRTTYGNWSLATGGSRDTARAMGVPVNRVKTINFMLCSMMASFTGIIVVARFNMCTQTFGLLSELEAVAATVIGGTYLFGGFGTILGCLMGTCIVGMIRVGLVMAGAPGYWYQTFVGGILVVAAVVNQKLRRAQA